MEPAATRSICVIGGDGIGPEVTDSAVAVLRHAVALVPGEPPLAVSYADAGHGTYLRTGDPLPPATLAAAQAADGVLLGALDGAALPPGVASPIGELRRGLQAHASLRPARSYRGVAAARPGVDLLVVREVTEGLYTGQEYPVEPDGVAAVRLVTRTASLRVARVAFARAAARRQRVTAVHKRGVLKRSDGVFLAAAEEVAAQHPQVELQQRNVDTCAMELVQHPEQFDVILATNAFGDILSDVAAGLTGGVGLAPSGCVGQRWAYFEPVHGTAPRRAGQARANPVAAVLSAAMMMRHLGAAPVAELIEQAVAVVLAAGPRTSDLGGSAGSGAMTSAIIRALDTTGGTR